MRFVGQSVKRVEDLRILTGRGKYVDDVQLPKMLHAAFVRSPYAHARIDSIDVDAAKAAPGVLAVYTGEEMRGFSKPITSMIPLPKWPEFYPLATDKVRLVGDMVAMVVATSRHEAEDACELVDVDYHPLPPIMTFEQALDPNLPPIFEEMGDNIVSSSGPTTFGDVDGAFAAADRVIELTLRQHRVAPVPMETRGAVADYDPASGELIFYSSTQKAQGLRLQLSETIGVPMERLHVVAKDVGGGFGLKAHTFREDFCVAIASKQLRQPVKWIEDRNEHLTASGQAREETVDVQVAVKDDGTLLGLKAKLIMNIGAYPGVPFPAVIFPDIIQRLMPGPYRFQGYQFESSLVSSNKAEYCAYRGPWEMETWVRERLVDVVAHELGIDPAEVRRRNMMSGEPDDRMITGLSLAGASSRPSLDRALALVGYESLRKEQEAARAEGRYLGIGMATFLEAAPGPPENRAPGGVFGSQRAHVTLQPDGHVVVATTQCPHGQGHETTLAQVAADELGVPIDHVRVVHSDTRQTPFSIMGTGGSRASTWASGAVIISARQVKEQVLAIASQMLEIDPADLEILDGMVTPKGVEHKSIPLSQVAMKVVMSAGMLPEGIDRLEGNELFTGARITGCGWSGGTHVCMVEVDLATGRVSILRYLVVEDCGRVINPAIVEGQIRGGVAQGIGEVLYEHAAYDDEGNFVAGTFMDYLLPTSAEIPPIEIAHLETEPDGDFDIRGVGEGGAIVAPATLTNAIDDALQPFGVRICDQYLPPSRVLELAGVIPLEAVPQLV